MNDKEVREINEKIEPLKVYTFLCEISDFCDFPFVYFLIYNVRTIND